MNEPFWFRELLLTLLEGILCKPQSWMWCGKNPISYWNTHSDLQPVWHRRPKSLRSESPKSPFHPYFFAFFKPPAAFFTTSTFLNALPCCYVIGWLDCGPFVALSLVCVHGFWGRVIFEKSANNIKWLSNFNSLHDFYSPATYAWLTHLVVCFAFISQKWAQWIFHKECNWCSQGC